MRPFLAKLWIICASALTVFIFVDVRILVRGFERLSHSIQRRTGRDCFFLSHVCCVAWLLFMMISFVHDGSLAHFGNAVSAALSLFVVVNIYFDLKVLISSDSHRRPAIGFRNMRIYKEWKARLFVLIVFALCLFISFRWEKFNNDDIAAGLLVATIYFRACTPLPPPPNARIKIRVPFSTRFRAARVTLS